MNIGTIVLFIGIMLLVCSVLLTIIAYRSFTIDNHAQLRITAIRLFLTRLKITRKGNKKWFEYYTASQISFFRKASWACRLSFIGLLMIIVQFFI